MGKVQVTVQPKEKTKNFSKRAPRENFPNKETQEKSKAKPQDLPIMEQTEKCFDVQGLRILRFHGQVSCCLATEGRTWGAW